MNTAGKRARGVGWFAMAFTCLGSAALLTADSLAGEDVTVAQLAAAIERLRPLHERIRKPGPSDWLAHHKEPGQTFSDYVHSSPVTPGGGRNALYIQPIGAFSEDQGKVVRLTADYMERFFNLRVVTNRTISLSAIPPSARRQHPTWGDDQILTAHVLNEILKPGVPNDAAAMIAFTTSDLWPGQGWNFVFGEASIRERVGVWSIYRNGDPGAGDAGFTLCLKRTIKTAVHETGHMFSMYHCTLFECCMCGSNHRTEADRQPLHFCPECTAKVCWATQTQPIAHYKRLMAFCEENGLAQEAAFLRKSIRRLEE